MRHLLSTVCFLASSVTILFGCERTQGSSLNEAWDARNNPLAFSKDFVLELSQLPSQGKIDSQPWSDTYWPSTFGGIASRWKVGQDNFSYAPPSRDELSAMSLAQKSELSPAEKYDAYLGRYDFPLLKAERGRTSPDRPGWEGLCHGWSVAALHFSEPKPVLVKSAEGIEIPFGSSDIKALLSLVQGNFNRSKSVMIGGRCNISLEDHPEAAFQPECRDLNAGAFHVILANYIGMRRKGFVVDVTRDQQVWNQPVKSFESVMFGDVPLSTQASPTAVKAVRVETKMGYQLESFAAFWDPTNSTAQSREGTKTYTYDLELDAQGRIVGGEWLTQDRPDFLWMRGEPEFADYFAPVKTLYLKSLQGPGLPDPSPVVLVGDLPATDELLPGPEATNPLIENLEGVERIPSAPSP